jgi:hypothetical protein
MEVPTGDWLDLERGEWWRTPEVWPLFLSDTGGAARRVLVEPEGASELWLLDFVHGRSELVMSEVDCSGRLVQDALDGARAIVSCMSEGGADDTFIPAARLHGYEWTELVDFDQRARYRSTQVFEGKLTRSGIAVGRRPGKKVELATLEPPD